MHRIFLLSSLFLLPVSMLVAQGASSVMTITVSEDLRGIGSNRSFLLVTEADGRQSRQDLERMTNISGLNFRDKAVENNEKMLVETLNQYLLDGWSIHTVSTNLLTSEGSTYLIVTRYVLEKKTQ
jgi:hypothetical protein